jgi:hypothetical protein
MSSLLGRIKTIPVLAAAAVISCAGSANAGAAFSSSAVGTTAMDFLNLGMGAKAMAMGGAYTAVAEDASACYWNPAGLAQINKFSAIAMQANYVDDISYQYFAYAQRINPYSVVGVSGITTNIGSINQTDIDGNQTGTFTPKDQAYSLSYSEAILELSGTNHDVSMGVTGRYISSQIVDTAKAYAVDVGLMGFYYTEIPYRLGMVVQNLGQGPKFDQETDALPLNIKFGGAVSPFHNFTVSGDLVLPKGDSMYGTLGGEFSIIPYENARLSLRAGLNTQQMNISGGTSGISMGIGIGLQYFSINYAYVPMGELGYANRFELTFDFPFWQPVFERKEKTIFPNFQEFNSTN